MDFSDSDEDSAVDRLISQAKDHIVLEQLSAINCSSFTDDDSVLPSHLESRFSRLKSFPATIPKTTASTVSFRHINSVPDPKSTTPPPPPPLENRESKPKPRCVSVSNSSPDSAIFSPPKRDSDEKKHRSAKSKSEWFSSSPLGSCNLLRDDSPSPPKKAGFCLWCSPKKEKKSGGGSSSQRKSYKDNAKVNGLGLDFSDDDEILAGLGSFSKKEQSRILKKAMKEEEKISREAEKIVKWAKQQSARMNVTGIDHDDELSD